jgi:hypothetical protein
VLVAPHTVHEVLILFMQPLESSELIPPARLYSKGLISSETRSDLIIRNRQP